jgi:hypothetical protein
MAIGKRSLHDSVDIYPTLAPAAYTSDTDGDSVNRSRFFAAAFEFTTGTWTSGDLIFHLEHRDDPADSWEAIPEEDLDGFSRGFGGTSVQQLTVNAAPAPDNVLNTYVVDDATKDGTVVLIQYIGIYTFLRARLEALDTPSATAGVNIILHDDRYQGRGPAANWDARNQEIDAAV